MLALDEQFVRCALVFISVCFILNVLLLGIIECANALLWHDRNCTPIMCYSNSLQWRQYTLRLWMDFDFDFLGINAWNGVLLFLLDEQYVRWYLSAFLNSLVLLLLGI